MNVRHNTTVNLLDTVILFYYYLFETLHYLHYDILHILFIDLHYIYDSMNIYDLIW